MGTGRFFIESLLCWGRSKESFKRKKRSEYTVSVQSKIRGIHYILPSKENILQSGFGHSSWRKELKNLELLTPNSFMLEGKNVVSLHTEAEIDLLIFETCDSTMNRAFRLINEDLLLPWAGVATVQQINGRGQLQRSWVSAPGNLYVSFLLPFSENAERILWNRLLPLLLGHCIRIALNEIGATVSMKWPNDLLQKQDGQWRKIGGLLVEERAGEVVVGFGLNLCAAPQQKQLRANHAFAAGNIMFLDETPRPLGIWSALVKRIKKEYEFTLEKTVPQDFVLQLTPSLLWMGETGILHDGIVEQHVTFLGLAPDGGLRIHGTQGEQVVYSGSISK